MFDFLIYVGAPTDIYFSSDSALSDREVIFYVTLHAHCNYDALILHQVQQLSLRVNPIHIRIRVDKRLLDKGS